MRLIDADALKADRKMGDKCEKCDRDTRSCQYEVIFSRMDVCSMLDDAPTIDALALLKEQEAVKPEKEHSGSGITWWNVCGNCKTAINPNDKYCHECGTPVLWEGR